MQIKLFNTLTRKLDDFQPIVPNHVGIYTCGPTVYDYAHIGNMRKYIHDDLLKRMFLANGYQVKHVMNITDVGHLVSDGDEGQDKMEKGAAREHKSVWDIAQIYTDAFFVDSEDLNIIRPKIITKATDYIQEQIDLLKKLEELGYTYEISGDGIYYDTSKFPSYGILTGGTRSGNIAGARVEFNKAKRNSCDFALWKFSPKGEKRQMEWESPWGIGFPGWHLECSAMSMSKLGNHFDVHTGGVDHIPIHHTNEIAQSEPIVGSPWVNYWVHSEFLIDKSGKMSKSSGEFLILPVLKKRGYDPIHYRYLVTLGHFGSQIVFSWEAMDAARNGYERIVRKIIDLTSNGSISKAENLAVTQAKAEEWKNKMLTEINNNINTAKSLVVFQEMLKDDKTDDATKLEVVRFADELFGLEFLEHATKLKNTEIPNEIKELANKRMIAKNKKDFASADSLRKQIESLGWNVMDSKDGYSITKK